MKINTPPFEHELSGTTSKMTSVWQNYIMILNNQINFNFSNNGYIFPSVIEDKLDKIKNNYKQSIVYNNNKNRFELNNGNRNNNNDSNYEPIQTYILSKTDEIAIEAKKQKNLGRIFVNEETNQLQFSIDGLTIRTITSV